ncbi:MAG TPA: hypothetical protein VH743_10750, partial [Beijerinckiaceae bacterium]
QAAPPPRPTNVVSLMDALRNSIAAERSEAANDSGKPAKQAAKSASRGRRPSAARSGAKRTGGRNIRKAG